MTSVTEFDGILNKDTTEDPNVHKIPEIFETIETFHIDGYYTYFDCVDILKVKNTNLLLNDTYHNCFRFYHNFLKYNKDTTPPANNRLIDVEYSPNFVFMHHDYVHNGRRLTSLNNLLLTFDEYSKALPMILRQEDFTFGHRRIIELKKIYYNHYFELSLSEDDKERKTFVFDAGYIQALWSYEHEILVFLNNFTKL